MILSRERAGRRALPVWACGVALAVAGVPAGVRAEEPPPPPSVLVTRFDGTTVRGSGVSFTDGHVVLGRTGGESRMPLASVLAVQWDVASAGGPDTAAPAPGPAPRPPGPVEVTLADGDVLRGEIVRGVGEEGFVVRTATLGEVPVDLDRVATVAWALALARAEDPVVLAPADGADVFLLAGGDRVAGTLRAVDPRAVHVRTQGGIDRTLPADGILGFALAPLPARAAPGVRARLVLRDGSRVTATTLSGDATAGLRAGGIVGDGTVTVSPSALLAVVVLGGDGACLSDLPESEVDIRPFWPDDDGAWIPRPERDRAVHLGSGTPPPLRVGGRVQPRGIGMFSGTTMTWTLEPGRWKTFTAAVAVDDGGPQGAVEFEVLVDGKSAWRSPVVKALPAGGAPLETPRISVEGARVLALRVHAGPGDDVHDLADWLRPALSP